MRSLHLYSLVVIAAADLAIGCRTTPREYWDSLKGDGFPGWSDSMAGGVRGNAAEAKSSGFFTDRRSEQIEKDLGGF